MSYWWPRLAVWAACAVGGFLVARGLFGGG